MVTRTFVRAAKRAEARRASSVREHLVIEHENGRLEDLGQVEVKLDASRRRVWKRPDLQRDGAAVIPESDYASRPFEVSMRDGARQFWYFGPHADSRLAAHRFNERRIEQRRTLSGR